MNKYACKLITPEQAQNLKSSLPVWFNPLWMNQVAELFNITPKVVLCSRNDNPAAWLPLYEKRFVTIKKAYNPTLVYYSPLVFDLPERRLPNRELMLEYDISKAVGEFLNKNYKRVCLNLNPQNSDIRGFKDAGLKTLPLYTFTVDLKQETDIHKHELTTLRKAEKQGYTYAENFEPEIMLDLMYNMYKRKKHPFPIPRDGLLHMLKALHQSGLIEQYNVRTQDTIVSSILIIKDTDQSVYAWLSGTAQEELKNGAGVFLLWKLFQTLQNRYSNLDLCGGNSKGPSRVKAALGAELRLFFQLVR